MNCLIYILTFTLLWANLVDDKLMKISYFCFPENRIWHFYKLSPMETICKKWQILFSWKHKTVTINFSSAGLAQRVVKVNKQSNSIFISVLHSLTAVVLCAREKCLLEGFGILSKQLMNCPIYIINFYHSLGKFNRWQIRDVFSYFFFFFFFFFQETEFDISCKLRQFAKKMAKPDFWEKIFQCVICWKFNPEC